MTSFDGQPMCGYNENLERKQVTASEWSEREERGESMADDWHRVMIANKRKTLRSYQQI